MQNILLGLALALALTSSAWGAPEIKAHEKKLSTAKDWRDLSAHLKGKMPSNVVREFSDFAKDIPFPASRRIKNTLVLTQNDGTKVSVVFKPDGAISLNGKDWKLRPLATVEEEVTRLALFLSGEKKADAGFFGFVPAAQAGGAGGMGVAAAVYAGANGWKAESCGEEELSSELAEDCPVMAVKMKPILIKSNISDEEKVLPTDLKCPVENRGVFELISKNKVGLTQRIRVIYSGSRPKKVVIELAEYGGSFQPDFKIDFDEKNDPKDIRIGEKATLVSSKIVERVCNGSQRDKERFLAMLESNKEETKVQKSNYMNSDDKNSIEAL